MAGVVGISLWQFVVAVASASLATFLGSFTVEFLKNRSAYKKRVSDYRIQLSIELEQLSKTIERLKTEYKSTKYYPLTFIGLALQQSARVDERLKTSSLLPAIDLQKKLFETVTETSILLTEIDASERWPLVDGLSVEDKESRQAVVKDQRIEKSVELSDLQRRLSDLVKEI